MFDVSEQIVSTFRVIMPWHQISHLPADQSLKKLTRHSPDLCHVRPIDPPHLTDFMQCRDHYMTPPVSLAILPSIQKTAFLASYEIRQNAAHLFSSEVVGSSCDPTHPMGRIGTALKNLLRFFLFQLFGELKYISEGFLN